MVGQVVLCAGKRFLIPRSRCGSFVGEVVSVGVLILSMGCSHTADSQVNGLRSGRSVDIAELKEQYDTRISRHGTDDSRIAWRWRRVLGNAMDDNSAARVEREPVHPFVNSSTLDAGSLQRPVAHTTDYRAPRKDIFSPLSTRPERSGRVERGEKEGSLHRVAACVSYRTLKRSGVLLWGNFQNDALASIAS